MHTHEDIRKMLALAAAGALDPPERMAVDGHVAGCEACRRELEILAMYALGLGEMPQPIMPEGLLGRTQARLDGHSDSRAQGVLLGVLAVFSAMSGVGWWLVIRALTGGGVSALGVSTLLVWTTAGVAAVMLAKRDELARRL